MASIGGLSSSTSNSVNMYGTSIKGYGGLASGLDTDSLIEGMTIGTRTKIENLLKDKKKNQWQTDAYRSISDKLVELQSKYLDTLNPNSLYRSSFFEKSLVTVNGANSDLLSVTGASRSLETLRVLGVGQLAKDTNLITNSNSSIQQLVTGNLDLSDSKTISNLEGESLNFKYGSGTYSLSLHAGRKITTVINGVEETYTTDYSTVDKTVESINKVLENTPLSGGASGMLGDKITLVKEGDTLVFKVKPGADTAGNDVKLEGGSDKALELLGFKDPGSGEVVGEGKITQAGLKGNTVDESTYTRQEYTWQVLAEKSIIFDYNGTAKELTLPDKNTLEAWASEPDHGKSFLVANIQNQLDRMYGQGKITVGSKDATGGGTGFSLTFETADASSIFRIKDAGEGMMGENGILGINYSTTNRLNTAAALDKSGLTGLPVFGAPNADGKYTPSDYIDEYGNLKMTINGVRIEGLTVNSSINQIIMAVNSSDAGVKMNYLETSDRFTLTATNHGEAGTIKLGATTYDGTPVDDFTSILFGKEGQADGYTKNAGQDAVMVVEYEGGVQGTIKRDTNTFNLEGSTFSLKNVFGMNSKAYDPAVDGAMTEAEKIQAGYIKNSSGDYVKFSESDPTGRSRLSFTTSVDAEKISKAVSSMIEEYNVLIKEVYDQVSTKPSRGYEPLSDEEKKDLSESEIKTLEDEAKKGILFNDSLLRSLSDKLRTVFTGSVDAGTLKSMGITVSSSYKDNGKLFFDEEAFKAALEADPDKVKNAFTRRVSTDADGNTTDLGGIAVRLRKITYDFANTLGTHGSLITKAGSSYSPLAESDNTMKKLRDEIDDKIDDLKRKLQTEINRYTKQFSSLEQLISQMNSQSGWFQQSMGG